MIRIAARGFGCLAVSGALVFLGSSVARADQNQPRTISVVPSDVRHAEGFDVSQSAGLFIGVTSFDDPRLAEVPYAVDDAVDLAYLFSVELELIAPDKVTLAITGDPKKQASVERLRALLGAGASQQTPNVTDIYRMLGEIPLEAGPKGLFVLSIATHGFSDQGSDFVVAADSRRRRIARTGIPIGEIFDDVSQARSPRRIVMIDACRERLSAETRAGGIDPDSKMTEGFTNAIAEAEGQVVLSGSTLGGYSYDDHELKNGVFSSAIIDGLLGRAPANDEGFITAVNLAEYVNERVLLWIGANRPQQSNSAKGIESRLSGNAAKMPLSMVTQERERFKAARTRGRRLVDVLENTADPQYVTPEMAKEISALVTSADPRALGPLLDRMDLLEERGAAYSEEFAEWWTSEGQAEFLDAIPLRVSIRPESRTLAVGQTQVFTVESNKPLKEEPLNWRSTPEGGVDVRATSSSTSGQKLHVRAENEGTVTIRIVDGNNVPRAEATIYVILLEQPSLRYPVITLAATTGLGIYTFFLNRDRIDKKDAWDTYRTETGLPGEDLEDEYNSALTRTRIVGASAAAGTVLTTYLWYRYRRADKAFKKSLKDVNATSRMDLDIRSDGVALVYKF